MFNQWQKTIFIMLLGMLFTSVAYAEKLDSIAAVINDEVVTESELKGEISALKTRLAQQKLVQPNESVLRDQVIDHLINIKLQLQLAKRNNIEIDNKAIDDAIVKMAKSNRMSIAELKKSLKKQGLSWKKYRENIKKEMLLSKVQQGAVGQVQVTDDEVKHFIESNPTNQDSMYHVKDLVLSLPESPSPETLEKATLRAKALMKKLKSGMDFSAAAVANSSGEFAFEGGDLGMRRIAELPEMFAKKVQGMKAGDIEGPIRAPNGLHIIKLVEVKDKAAKQLVKLTHVRHILLKTEAGESEKNVEARLQTIALQIKRGRSFADLAKQFSMDVQSAAKGGDIGWVHKGEVVPQFEEAMDKLKPGQMSAPVKTDFGYHLIKVEGRKEIDDSKAYQREVIRQGLYRRKFYDAVQNWVQQLRANSYVSIKKPATT